MRYAYIKNGDAVEQVHRLASAVEVDESGPDAFIGDFLRAHAEDDVLVVCRAARDRTFTQGRITARGFREYYPSLGALVSRSISAFRAAWAVFRWKPERILCGCTSELLWASVLVAKLRRVPIVNSRHNEIRHKKGPAAIAGILDLLCVRTCVGVACHGPFTASQILALGLPKSKVFDFDVSLADFAVAAADLPCADGLAEFASNHRGLLLFVGRVQADKGAFDLLAAFRMLKGEHPELGLIYVGEGKDLATLKAAAGGLGDDVLFLGRLEHKSLPPIFRHVTLTVTPTRPEFPEGRCMVVLESLVMGVPVVAPNFGPFPYAIEHDVNGLLFEAGDDESLREQLRIALGPGNVLERLRSGAARSASQLLRGNTSFAAAVDRAFGARERRAPLIGGQ